MKFGNSSNNILENLKIRPELPLVINKIISRYAECFPIVFEKDSKLNCIFPNSMQLIPIKIDIPSRYYYKHYDWSSGVIICFSWEEDNYKFYQVNINLNAVTVEEYPMYNFKELTKSPEGEHTVVCTLSESDELVLGFGWGWRWPVTSYHDITNNSMEPRKWMYPSETTSYQDGWTVSLYHFNNYLMLTTEDGIYITQLKMKINAKDWKTFLQFEGT